MVKTPPPDMAAHSLTLSTTDARYVGVSDENHKRMIHMRKVTLLPMPTPFLLLPHASEPTLRHIVTPDSKRAIHCLPTGQHTGYPGSQDKTRIGWTDIDPTDGHSSWHLELQPEGTTTFRWNPCGGGNAAVWRSWNLYLSVSDAGELVMSPTPYPWRLTATAPPPVLVVEEPPSGVGAGDLEPMVAPPPSALEAENERLRAVAKAKRDAHILRLWVAMELLRHVDRDAADDDLL